MPHAPKSDEPPTPHAGKRPQTRRKTGARSAGPPRKATKPLATARTTPLPLYVLSDSTGNLAMHMMTAFLTQFPEGTFALKSMAFLTDHDKLVDALFRAANDRAAIVHAVVNDEAKKTIAEFCESRGMACQDLTGSFVDFLAVASGVAPRPNVTKLHETSDSYNRRIDAIEFTLAHDDGLGLETIHEADVVLTGISRTSKTPTSIYLGQQGYRTANVALAIEVEPPRELLMLPARKVVGLVIHPSRLLEVRGTRKEAWTLGNTNYTDSAHVEEEVKWSKRLFARQGWRTIDVSHSAIEETAARVIELLNLNSRPK